MKPKRLSSEKRKPLNKTLLLFAFVYGQITSAVVVVTAVVYLLGEPRGVELCESIGMGLMACRALSVVLIAVAFAVSGVVGVVAIRRRP